MAGKKRSKGPQQKGGGDDARKKRKSYDGPKRQEIDLPVDAEEHDETDVSDEDVEFVKDYGKSIDFLTSLDKQALDRSVTERQSKESAAYKKKQSPAEEDSEEEQDGKREAKGKKGAKRGEEDEADYEQAPRRVEKGAQRVQSRGGLPIKMLDGQVVFQQPKQRKNLRMGDGEEEKGGAGEEEVPVASMLPMHVAGVTIIDDMEETQKALAEAAKQAVFDEARAARGRKALQQQREVEEEEEAADGLPAVLASSLKGLHDQSQRREALKEAMAMSAQKLLSGPEDHVGELRTLLALATNEDMQVSRLALLSLMAVFRDIIPGYRIRPPSDAEMQVKVSREVQKVRDYEAALLKAYQAYLKLLLSAMSKGSAPGGNNGRAAAAAAPKHHARVAVKCMCQLLASLPHFNYTSDLLQAVVPRMTARDDAMRTECCACVQQLLKSDVDGGVALEAVQLVADLVKNRKCDCHPEVVRVLAVLTFSEIKRDDPDADGKKSKAKEVKAKKPGKKAAAAAKLGGPGMPVAAIEALKARAANSKSIAKDVDREFREADAGPDARLQAIRQSKMLEALFEVYFRVLKQCTTSGLASIAQEEKNLQAGGSAAPAAGAASSTSTSSVVVVGPVAGSPGWNRQRVLRKFPLLYPTLEGLARYTHLISIDYFNDLMEVFKQLLRSPALPLVDRLRLLLTASDILRGQAEALNIDRRDFYIQLYGSLTLTPYRQVSDAPMGGDGETPEDDPNMAQAVGETFSGQESLPVLLASTLQQMLCDVKISDMARVAAFLKRSASMMLCCSSSEAMVLMGSMLRVLRRYPRLLNMLEYEGEAPVGGRLFDPGCADPGEAGAMASSLWELPALACHYHPHVVQAAASLLAMGLGASGSSNLSGPLAMAGTTRELALAYDASGGAFKPAPAMPKARRNTSASAVRKMQQAATKLASTPELQLLLKKTWNVECDVSEDAMGQHYRVLRRFETNRELRRQKLILLEKLKRFNVHLAEKR